MLQFSAPVTVEEQLRDAIRQSGGVISFARFMDLALYAPGKGYYERTTQPIGKRGDFYTSVSVGPVFGQLLAFQFSQWLAEIPEAPCHLVEAGAHDGRLAADILEWFSVHRPDQAKAIQYWIVEPSPMRRQWQQVTLDRYRGQIHCVPDLSNLASSTGGVRGVIFSNELLDAFPAHRLRWDAAAPRWDEIGVTWNGSCFVWKAMELPSTVVNARLTSLNELPTELLRMLPDGFCTEFSPAATAWWREAATALASGRLMTCDYGLTSEEFLLPERASGTIRGYRRHRFIQNILDRPGDSDITAHVDFDALASAGESVGLRTEVHVSQRAWLTAIFEQSIQTDSGLPTWTPARTRQFQTLTHPEHLGRAFRVLVQRRAS